MWCPDCVQMEASLIDLTTKTPSTALDNLIYVYVGQRDEWVDPWLHVPRSRIWAPFYLSNAYDRWRSPSNHFRNEPWNIERIPTVLKVGPKAHHGALKERVSLLSVLHQCAKWFDLMRKFHIIWLIRSHLFILDLWKMMQMTSGNSRSTYKALPKIEYVGGETLTCQGSAIVASRCWLSSKCKCKFYNAEHFSFKGIGNIVHVLHETCRTIKQEDSEQSLYEVTLRGVRRSSPSEWGSSSLFPRLVRFARITCCPKTSTSSDSSDSLTSIQQTFRIIVFPDFIRVRLLATFGHFLFERGRIFD